MMTLKEIFAKTATVASPNEFRKIIVLCRLFFFFVKQH